MLFVCTTNKEYTRDVRHEVLMAVTEYYCLLGCDAIEFVRYAPKTVLWSSCVRVQCQYCGLVSSEESVTIETWNLFWDYLRKQIFVSATNTHNSKWRGSAGNRMHHDTVTLCELQ
jgi:hypothetical protein